MHVLLFLYILNHIKLLILHLEQMENSFKVSQQTEKEPETKIAELVYIVDLDEVGQNEPPHLDLHCVPSSI